MNQDERDFEIFKLLALTALAVVALTAGALAFIWLVTVAAGTWWSVSVVAFGIVLIWVIDILWPRRSRVTPLQRFEEREERRHAA